jgi:amino acid transporter
MLARDGLAPATLGRIHARTATPVVGLSWTLAIAALLLLSGPIGLALNIAVFALVLLYLIHSLALLLLPRANPELYRKVTLPLPRALQVLAAWCSILAMSALLLVQVGQDLDVARRTGLLERARRLELTTLELSVVWALLGAVLFGLERRRVQRDS